MNIDAPIVLAPGTRLIPSAELRPEDRERAGCRPEDVVLTRGGVRARSKLLQPEGRRIVECFRAPCRIVDAVRNLARESNEAADAILERAFPLLKLLINDGLLIDAEAAKVEPEPPLPRAASIGPFRILRCIQLYDDTALYQADDAQGRKVALKIARNEFETTLALLRREAALMAEVPCPPGPRLIDADPGAARPWLAVEWIEGTLLIAKAAQLRREARSADDLLALAAGVLDAYADLHETGIVHGDVHPGNVLIDAASRVRILDFGYSRSLREGSDFVKCKRGGVSFFFEPEYANAHLAAGELPLADVRSEQYALGALVYLTLAGKPYLDFSFDEGRMFRQIADQPMRAFAECGFSSWPAVERVLRRALEKSSSERFEDVRAFALALREAAMERAPSVAAPTVRVSPAADMALARSVAEFGPDSPTLECGLKTAPRASVHSGAAGIAYGLFRIAAALKDAHLLATARLWSEKAMADRSRSDAFYSEADGISVKTVGEASIAHGAIGVAFVHGLIAGAVSDAEAAREALKLFLAEADRPSETGDLFLGDSGHLVAATGLLGLIDAVEGGPDTKPLVEFGDALSRRLEAFMATQPPIDSSPTFQRLGMAHGWAGLLYALLGWSRRRNREPIAGSTERLDQLRAIAVTTDAGLRWPILIGGDALSPEQHMHGWCNGGAGHVLLWLLAAECLGDPRLVDTAVAAAGDMAAGCLTAKGRVPFLCCGQVGGAFAMMALHHRTGETRHLASAVDLIETAETSIRNPTLPPASLFRGALGLAVAAAHLHCPGEAAFPIFGLARGEFGVTSP